MMREKLSYYFLRSLVKDQDNSFFKDLTGVFCTVGGTLVFWGFFFRVIAPSPNKTNKFLPYHLIISKHKCYVIKLYMFLRYIL
jgi:hypothetical protein